MAKDDIIEHQFDKRTAKEQQEIARMGGKASGRARQRKKKFRDELEALLTITDVGKDGQPVINPLTGKKQSIQQTITMQLLLKARKGDIKATKLILETLGERMLKTAEQHDITLRQTRYDNMTEEELIAESKRLDDSINNL